MDKKNEKLKDVFERIVGKNSFKIEKSHMEHYLQSRYKKELGTRIYKIIGKQFNNFNPSVDIAGYADGLNAFFGNGKTGDFYKSTAFKLFAIHHDTKLSE